jgi:hypothetical protein
MLYIPQVDAIVSIVFKKVNNPSGFQLLMIKEFKRKKSS